jgi:hypothetical protein
MPGFVESLASERKKSMESAQSLLFFNHCKPGWAGQN